MPMDSVTEENVEKLMLLKGNKEAELSQLESSNATSLWLDDLKEFEDAYLAHRETTSALRVAESCRVKGGAKKHAELRLSKSLNTIKFRTTSSIPK